MNSMSDKTKAADWQAVVDGVNHLGQAFTIFNADLELVFFNQQMNTILGFPENYLRQGMKLEEIFRYNAERGEYGKGDIETLVAERMELARKFEPHRYERSRPDGTVVEIIGNPLPQGGFVTTYTDITERRKTQEKLRLASIVLENANESISVTDTKNEIIFVNPAFEDFTGYRQEEILGKRPGFMRSGRHDESFYTEIHDSMEEHGTWQGEISYRRKNGEFYVAWVSLTAIHADDGSITNHICIAHDITSRKENEERIWRQANYDALTQLPNRSLFRERLTSAIEYSRHDDAPFSLIYLDLDGFKPVNDIHGHGMGDELLKAVGKRLKKCIRINDTVARLGGDEFAIICLGIDERDKTVVVAEKILKALAKPFVIDGTALQIYASLGIAFYEDRRDTADMVIDKADKAMYASKRAGKNQYTFAS